MTQDQSDFVDFCKELRLLGATKVSGKGWHVEFEGRLRTVAVAPETEPAEESEEEQALTREQAIEKQYARELGRAPPATK